MHADIVKDTLIAKEMEDLSSAIVTHMLRWHRSRDCADMTTAKAFLDELVGGREFSFQTSLKTSSIYSSIRAT